MTIGSTVAVIPQNKREEEALEILDRLEGGGLLGKSDSRGILRSISGTLTPAIKSAVKTSREEGCTSRRRTFWIVAPRGGGKSETIESLAGELLIETPRDRSGKSIVVSLDLKKASETSSSSGIQADIFQAATITGSSPFKKQLDELAKHLANKSRTEGARDNLIELGIDIALGIAGVTAPGASAVGTHILARLWRRWRLRDGRIRKLLEDRGIVDPKAVNLLTKWVAYCTRPSFKRWQDFEHIFQPLASEEILFPMLCAILQASGYATIILLFDEGDKLVQATNLTRALEALWDPPRDSDHYYHKMNIFFVLAGTDDIHSLEDEGLYEGFTRRFVGPRAARNPVFKLRGPHVEENPDSNDDFSHAYAKIDELCQTLPGLHFVRLDLEQESKLRKEMATQGAESELTWHDLWARICHTCVPSRFPIDQY